MISIRDNNLCISSLTIFHSLNCAILETQETFQLHADEATYHKTANTKLLAQVEFQFELMHDRDIM